MNTIHFQLNGKNCQGENIADNGGIRETYRAYSNSVASEGAEPKLPGLTQFTSEQLLFVSYAQVQTLLAADSSSICPNVVVVCLSVCLSS